MDGGPDNADGNYEAGNTYVTGQFSTTCLPEIRGTSVPTPTSAYLTFGCDKFDLAVQSTAISILAFEMNLQLSPTGVPTSASAAAAPSSTAAPLVSSALTAAPSAIASSTAAVPSYSVSGDHSAAPILLSSATSASGALFPSLPAVAATGITTPSPVASGLGMSSAQSPDTPARLLEQKAGAMLKDHLPCSL